MKTSRALSAALTPWAGLVIGLIAAAFVHQFGSEGTFDHCDVFAPGPAIVVALAGLVATLTAGFTSWRSMRGADETRRLIAAISVGMALLFAFAIILPVFAAVLISPCFQ